MAFEKSENKPTGFFAQLRERKVYRVAAGYAVSVFILMQIIDSVGAALGVTDTVVRVILAILLVLFPLILVITWYLEITDSGIRVDQRFSDHLGRYTEAVFGITVIVITLGIAIYLYLTWDMFKGPSRSATTVMPSLAVLPFASVGEENRYLSHGLPDQLLARLDRITEFTVASRTSSAQFDGATHDVRDIGAMLGVTHVLEGSVQQSQNDVLITVQLIDVDKDDHVWSDSYHIKGIDDVLNTEIEIASSIADSLKIALSRESASMLTQAMTSDKEAYRFNLQGWDYFRRPRTESNLTLSAELFQRAIDRDASYLDPRVGLCQVQLALFRVSEKRSYFDEANQTCLKVAASDYRSAETYAALGDLNRAVGNLKEAETYYKRALEQDDRHFGAYDGLAEVQRAQGRLDEAEATLQRGVSQNRGYATAYRAYAYFLSVEGRWADAAAQLEHAVELADDSYALSNLGLAYYSMGDWTRAQTVWQRSLEIEPNMPALANLATLHYYSGDLQAAESCLLQILEDNPDSMYALGQLAAVYREQEKTDLAERFFRQAVDKTERSLSINPDDTQLLGRLASYHANLGEMTRAREYLDKALKISPDNFNLHYYAALIASLENRWDDAAASVSRAVELGYSEKVIRADPRLKPLYETNESARDGIGAKRG